MPAYNFKKQFAPLVESGEKRQTIRQPRKRKTVKGDKLYLYTGMRTKNCRKLAETTCKNVFGIEIKSKTEIVVTGQHLAYPGSVSLGYDDMLDLAMADGFETISEFTAFFENQYGLPFAGEVIQW